MSLESLALLVASTSGFLPGLLSCTTISLPSDTSARMAMQKVQISCCCSNYPTLGFLSVILNRTLFSPGISTHICLVCFYLPILPLWFQLLQERKCSLRLWALVNTAEIGLYFAFSSVVHIKVDKRRSTWELES